VPLALAAATFLLYVRARHFDFIALDDRNNDVNNGRVLSGLSGDNVAWAFSTFKLANYHPLTWLGYMTIAHFWGAEPAAYHVVNVVIHAMNAALVYLLLASLTRAPVRSAIAAALFAVHPLRLESVAWVAEFKDVLCATFFLLSLIAYGRYARATENSGGAAAGRQAGWYFAALLAFVLGSLTKPMIVTLPCVLLLLDYWPLARLRRETIGRLVLEKLPFFVLAGVSSLITMIAQREGGAIAQPGMYPPALRLGNVLWSYGRYLRRTFWPDDLAVFYPYYGAVPGTTFPWALAIGSAACLLLVTWIAWQLRRREPAVLIGWLWFLGMLVPTIGLVQVGAQAMADRYSYLPHIGLLVAVVWGVSALVPAPRRTLAGAAGGLAIVALAAATLWQLPFWQNTYTLFTRALAVTHDNVPALASVGLYYQSHGEPAKAAEQYLQALQIEPDNADVLNYFGGLLRDVHRPGDAVPVLAKAVERDPKNAEARNNFANALADVGNIDQAVKQFDAAVALDPELAGAWANYALTLAGAGRVDDALPKFRRAVELRPADANTRYTYAIALAPHDPAGAIEQLRAAVRLRPNWPQAMNRLAWLLATAPDAKLRNPTEASAMAQDIVQRAGGQQPQPLDTLAAAQAAAGRFDLAVETAQRALSLAEARGPKDYAERVARRLALYRAHQPFVTSLAPASQAATTATTAPAAGAQLSVWQ
jgi:Tfp pilus assembly protein PilF